MKAEMFLVKDCFDILDFNNMLLKYLNIWNYSIFLDGIDSYGLVLCGKGM